MNKGVTMNKGCYSQRLVAAGLLVVAATTSLLLTNGLPILRVSLSPASDQRNQAYLLYVSLFMAAMVLCGLSATVVSERQRKDSVHWYRVSRGLVFCSMLGLIVNLWSFNLDDKWIYYRTSRYVLKTGLPIWNLGEFYNVNTAFLYPYILAPGHWFGDWSAWESYSKVIGLSAHAATGYLVFHHFARTPWATLLSASILLYVPALLWSLGGLETSLATLLTVGVSLRYLKHGPQDVYFWLLTGGLMWLRPDAILIGAGTLISLALRRGMCFQALAIRALLFASPILVFLSLSTVIFSMPLPSPFYIKGLNKAFSGHYTLLEDFLNGFGQLASALSTSVVILFLFIGGMWVLATTVKSQANALHRDIAIGCLTAVGYFVICGYQHMGFTFRYFLPALIPFLVICGDLVYQQWLLNKTAARSLGQPLLLILGLCLLISQSLAVSHQIKHFGVALTLATPHDRFSLVAYAQFLSEWMEAGDYARGAQQAGDRMFVYQSMVTGALTDMYFVDQFYHPPPKTNQTDIRGCPDLQQRPACAALYDYIFSWPEGPDFSATHALVRRYSNILILKRKPGIEDIYSADPTKAPGIPGLPVPSGLMCRLDKVQNMVLVQWERTLQATYYELEISERRGHSGETSVSIVGAPGGNETYGVGNVATTSIYRFRIRACYSEKCSAWSESAGLPDSAPEF
jgi:hypothetical protein